MLPRVGEEPSAKPDPTIEEPKDGAEELKASALDLQRSGEEHGPDVDGSCPMDEVD